MVAMHFRINVNLDKGKEIKESKTIKLSSKKKSSSYSNRKKKESAKSMLKHPLTHPVIR